MAFVPAQQSRVLAGPVNFSVYSDSWGLPIETDMLDVTCFANSDNTDMDSRAFIPGLSTSTVSFAGPLDVDSTANGAADVLADWKGSAALPVTIAPSGLTALSECFMVAAYEVSVEDSVAPTDPVSYSFEGQTSGETDYGVVLENLTAVTTDGNGTARDLTGATTNGGVAHLHVTAFSGLTNNIVTIEDSADGSTGWATILTFSTYTAVTSERVAISGTVRRHLRVVDNVTGTGSTTRAVTFARR